MDKKFLNMATFPICRILNRNQLMKCYLWRYISASKKYLSSKDNSDDNISKEKIEKKENKHNEPFSKLKADTSSKIPPNEQTKEAAKKKLFSLLSEITPSRGKQKIKPDLVLAKPLKRINKKERFKDLEKEKKSPEKDIKAAVETVSKSVEGDPEKTEMELKEKLSSLNLIQDDSDKDKKFKFGTFEISETLSKSMMSSVKDVAATVKTPIKSKLAERLMRLSREEHEPQSKVSIKNMMKGMAVEKSRLKSEARKRDLPDVKPTVKRVPRPAVQSRISISQSPPLNIFSLNIESKEENESKIWQNLENKRVKLLSEFAPANAFEEMIMWTEQGKHWKFPIDNEIEMGEEENVGFHEHVFLEHHLKGFPTRGPIRHFMELVVVGLSKNPYITVERKIENINWFREYFEEKKDILKQYGAIE